ncbi:C4-type zinc ribbon domain-containing protein [Spirochaetia bacterium 38H-sp]|uniref:C4-type zinc ribbon domain-containing protein n=1 Tax=Rarispira pelagica TaxID=3141764 RepID=A0ABU9UAQ6_9SPIR
MLNTHVLNKLKELQTILSERFILEKEIKQMPQSLTTQQDMLKRLKEDFISKNQKYEYVKNKIKQLTIQLQEAENKRVGIEARMEHLETQREYEAAEKEIAYAKEKENEIRRELQKEEARAKDLEETITREKNVIQSAEDDIKNEESLINEKLAEKQAKLNELMLKEKEITPDLDPDVVFKFSRIIKSKEGIGIVPVIKDVCTGCNILLPREFVNKIRRADEIVFCPHCSRILFFQQIEDEKENLVYESDVFGELSDLVEEDDLFEDELFEEEQLDIYDSEDDIYDSEDIEDDEDDEDDEELKDDDDFVDDDFVDDLDDEEITDDDIEDEI